MDTTALILTIVALAYIAAVFLIIRKVIKWYRKKQTEAFRKNIEWEERIRQEVREEYRNKK